jgi:probable phosphoglycerate mutase
VTTTEKAGSTAGPAFAVPALPDSAQLWIVRHGETEWSKSGRHTGSTDIPLTPAGQEQAKALRDMLAALRPVLVLCSPRQRAMETARLAGLDVDEVTEDLAEWDYGKYEGLTTSEIQQQDPGWTIFSHPAPGGETPEQIRTRADRVLERAAARLADGPVVLVGHGHFSRVLGARWMGLPVGSGANLLLGTAAPSMLGAQHGIPAIVRWNIPNPAAQS